MLRGSLAIPAALHKHSNDDELMMMVYPLLQNFPSSLASRTTVIAVKAMHIRILLKLGKDFKF